MKSFASLLDTRDAFAMTVARNADDLEGSIADSDRISFMSYLNGLILCVLSIDCLFVDSLVFGCLLFFFSLNCPALPPMFCPADLLRGWLVPVFFF